jgi:lipopolysaccharide transport system ATP-binding protein
MPNVLEIDRVSKQYRLGEVSTRSLGHDLNRWWHRVRRLPDPYLKVTQENRRDRAAGSGAEADYVWALRDISFAVERGEVLGVVGRNGAGKSTLLKILARVSPATLGSVRVQGLVFPMIELNAGLNEDLNGDENIEILGAIMGLSRAQINERRGMIMDFSELDGWMDKPVRKYSSGMKARLGFSVAVHADADIVLLDEVLGVGDAAFQKKSIASIDRLLSEGRTVLFVSHNPYAIERVCNRVIYMREGEIVMDGQPSDVISEYFQEGVRRTATVTQLSTGQRVKHIEATQDFTWTHAELLDRDGQPVTAIAAGEPATIRFHMEVQRPVRDFNIALRIVDAATTIVVNMQALHFDLETTGHHVVDVHAASLPLVPGPYWVTIHAREINALIDQLDNALTFDITGGVDTFYQSGHQGLVFVPNRWQITPTAELRETPTPEEDICAGNAL